LRARELRLISVWHPSFLGQLLEALAARWDRLIVDLAVRDPRRAAELRRLRPDDVQGIWPTLGLISCWGDGPARSAAESLARRFPHVEVQPKGLIATEAIVTIPFAGRHPLAIGSHFFEFIDSNGCARLAHQLERGVDYTVVVTTGGGLYRYRLADRVPVTAGARRRRHVLSRQGGLDVGSVRREAEYCVRREVLRSLLPRRPAFAMSAPDRTGSAPLIPVRRERPVSAP
jgi:hypothetical protein